MTHPLLLSAADEIRLARTIEAGLMAGEALRHGCWAAATPAELSRLEADGRQAWQDFLMANVRLVQTVAVQVSRRCDVGVEELFQEGFLGLGEALLRWDFAAGYRFSTYALQWIRRRVVDASVSACVGTAGSTRQALRAKRVRVLAAELTGELQRVATDAEVAPLLGRSSAWVGRMRVLHRHAPLPDEAMAESSADEDTDSDVLALLPGLPWPERRVLEMRFGLDGGDGSTQRDVGTALGLSLSTVRRHEARALRRLRGWLADDLAA